MVKLKMEIVVTNLFRNETEKGVGEDSNAEK